MNEAEYLMKNYGDRGGCYPSRPLAKAEKLDDKLMMMMMMMMIS